MPIGGGAGGAGRHGRSRRALRQVPWSIEVDGLERKISCWQRHLAHLHEQRSRAVSRPWPDGEHRSSSSCTPTRPWIAFLDCPTSPYGPRGNFCAFTALPGTRPGFERRCPSPHRDGSRSADAHGAQGRRRPARSRAGGAIDCGRICTATLRVRDRLYPDRDCRPPGRSSPAGRLHAVGDEPGSVQLVAP